MYLATNPSKLGRHLGDGAMVGGDDLAQILGIEPRRQRGRADEIAEHHRQLTPFARPSARELRRGGQPSSAAAVAASNAAMASSSRRRWPTEAPRARSNPRRSAA